jgi:gas vesicle protein
MNIIKNELRIGNLVDLGNRIAKIIEIGHLSCVVVDLEETQDTIEDYNRTKPIPLAEEWLFKFGFVTIDKGDNDYITYADSEHVYYLQLDVRKKDGKYTILDNSFDDLINFSMVDISYVHELQNLYFALTGEELTLNKCKEQSNSINKPIENKKTAIQELINEIVEHLTYDDDLSDDSRTTLETIRLRCLGKLSAEKKQIEDAYKEGCFDNILDESTDKIRAEKYYNETYEK